MAEKKNMFAEAQKKREAQQADIKAKCGVKSTQVTTKRKVRLDVTVPQNTKERLLVYAEKKGLSASVVVQMLIDEGCV